MAGQYWMCVYALFILFGNNVLGFQTEEAVSQTNDAMGTQGQYEAFIQSKKEENHSTMTQLAASRRQKLLLLQMNRLKALQELATQKREAAKRQKAELMEKMSLRYSQATNLQQGHHRKEAVHAVLFGTFGPARGIQKVNKDNLNQIVGDVNTTSIADKSAEKSEPSTISRKENLTSSENKTFPNITMTNTKLSLGNETNKGKPSKTGDETISLNKRTDNVKDINGREILKEKSDVIGSNNITKENPLSLKEAAENQLQEIHSDLDVKHIHDNQTTDFGQLRVNITDNENLLNAHNVKPIPNITLGGQSEETNKTLKDSSDHNVFVTDQNVSGGADSPVTPSPNINAVPEEKSVIGRRGNKDMMHEGDKIKSAKDVIDSGFALPDFTIKDIPVIDLAGVFDPWDQFQNLLKQTDPSLDTNVPLGSNNARQDNQIVNLTKRNNKTSNLDIKDHGFILGKADVNNSFVATHRSNITDQLSNENKRQKGHFEENMQVDNITSPKDNKSATNEGQDINNVETIRKTGALNNSLPDEQFIEMKAAVLEDVDINDFFPDTSKGKTEERSAVTGDAKDEHGIRTVNGEIMPSIQQPKKRFDFGSSIFSLDNIIRSIRNKLRPS